MERRLLTEAPRVLDLAWLKELDPKALVGRPLGSICKHYDTEHTSSLTSGKAIRPTPLHQSLRLRTESRQTGIGKGHCTHSPRHKTVLNYHPWILTWECSQCHAQNECRPAGTVVRVDESDFRPCRSASITRYGPTRLVTTLEVTHMTVNHACSRKGLTVA